MSDRQEFIDAVRAAAWVVDDIDSADYGRKLIGCRGSFTHADWDLHTVEAEIAAADDVRWDRDSFGAVVFGAQLQVHSGEHAWRFEVRAPAVAS